MTNLTNVDKNLLEVLEEAKQFLIKTKSLVGFSIIYGFRSQEEQLELYKKGRSRKNGKWVETGKVVTYIDGYYKKSKHQEGKAVDIMAKYDGRGTWDVEYYYYIAGIVAVIANRKNLNIIWGGWFKRTGGQRFVDAGHFEIE